MKFFFKLRLKTKILISFSLLTAILLASAFILLLKDIEKEKLDQYLFNNLSDLKNFIELNTPNLVLRDHNELVRNLNNFIFDKGLQQVLIQNENGDVIAFKNIISKNNIISSENLIITSSIQLKDYSTYTINNVNVYGEKYYLISHKIYSKLTKEYLGNIELISSPSYFQKDINKKKVFILWFAALFGIIGFFIIYLLSQAIIKPIKILENFFEQSKNSKLQEIKKDKIPSPDFNNFIDSYNKMVKNVYYYQDKANVMQQLAAIGRTTAMVAHDVRKPFALVKAFLDQIPVKRFDDDFIKNSQREIDRSISQVESMIEDTLEFTRDREPELAPCNPQSLITTSLRETFKIYRDTDICFNYNFKHTSYLNIDAMKMLRVFNNIIGNAVEAMEIKGKIWFKTRDIKIDGKENMEVILGNSGPMIEASDIEKIFDPFFTKGKKRGTGLGLAISKKIIDLHGGDIKIISEKERGTEFILTIPTQPGNLSLNIKEVIRHSSEIKYEPEKEIVRELDTRIGKLNKLISKLKSPLKILIVDDEPLFRSSLRSMINGISVINSYLEIVEVSNGEEALKLVEKDSFAYVISDIDMGEENMDGFEFTKRYLAKNTEAKIVIHSNWNLPDTQERAKEAGAVGFISKPMTKLQFVEFLMTGQKDDSAKVVPIEKAKEKKEHAQDIVSTKSKILIIEDDEYIANYTKTILEKEYSCVKALNGEEGLKKAQEIIPDLIILDLIMPGKSGSEVCKELKANENTKHISIIILTGKSDLDTKIESLELGASEFLTKPFNKVELQTRVKSLLNQNKLSNLIKKKNIELTETLRKLKETQDHLIQSEKMASLGRLASGMAHEIRNPMNFIQNATDPIKENFKEMINKNLSKKELTEMDNDTSELFKIIQEGVDRTLGVVSGINSFTRGAVQGFQMYNINEAVDSSLSISTNEYKNEIDITTDLKVAKEIKCNRGQINQVVLNLLMNAFEAVKEKKKAKGKVQIKTWEEDGHVKLSVKDNGPGIKDEEKQRIFDPFFTTKETKPGQNMGLGLSICYNIIDVHRGRIDVNSEKGKGAEFIISLPIS